MVLVSRRMERTVYSLLGGVGVTAVEDGDEASSQCSSVLLCCCLTSRSDCSKDKGRAQNDVPRGTKSSLTVCQKLRRAPPR